MQFDDNTIKQIHNIIKEELLIYDKNRTERFRSPIDDIRLNILNNIMNWLRYDTLPML